MLSVDHPQILAASLNSDLELNEVYGRRSGGERKRTDLALLFSLFDMVRSRSRFLPDFILLDEVFDALDASGRAAIQTVLTSLASRLGKVVLISHTDVASGLPVAGTITVNMNFRGSHPSGSVVDIRY